MTEHEWLTAADPEALVEFLDKSGMNSRRKSRLLSCASCYRLDSLLIQPQSLQAVRLAEAWADDEHLANDVRAAWLEAGPARTLAMSHRTDSPEYIAAMAAFDAANPKPNGRSDVGAVWSALSVIDKVIEAIGRASAEARGTDWVNDPATIAEAVAVTSDLRDIFGNPFRPVAIDPAWRTSTVVALARGIYDEKAFDRMPILADALQDAGCDNDNVLSHCRGDGPHVRGCWVVDLLLGKE
ncbi:Uncharacterized protein OS=Sorangium cellulosum (strain So ce56) GN=sce5710 PE=4 SV=1 [Gemmataceae bacterium]|nr:Uncharacterized protein OS=Sorangium cellulosum (strain So ce56) GN=sce5710 PE=4 SV=1 [Gemmataceae bacterium]VTU01988.1 Uncharacterized protein OS=Sorangium cellulosum (strain So ce56) GN=sce5710 PE=4 SV=1 [Gemmataceae bacterium]